jgi:DDE family transposase
MAACLRTGLPLAWRVETARSNESQFPLSLIDKLHSHGLAVETCAMDKGYDLGPIYDGCEARDVRPIIPLRQTTAVARGDAEPPRCEHGEWRLERVQLHARLTVVAKLSCALGRTRAIPLVARYFRPCQHSL